MILSHHLLLLETFFVTFWEVVGFVVLGGEGGGSGGALQDFLISFTIFSQYISRFQASKTQLKKETVVLLFQWKELTKQKNSEFLLTIENCFQLRQNTGPISTLPAQIINEAVVQILLSIYSGTQHLFS